MTTLLGPGEVRELAGLLGVQPTKKLGQNFVIDPNTIRKIVAAAELTPDDRVVEIGPGLGSLTLGLIESGAPTEVVEIDERLARQLPDTLARFAPGATVPVVHADALRVTELPTPPTALVANLPYNVSVPVLLHFLHTFPTIRHGLVMVQAEVAHRMAADPGSRVYGAPTVKAAWYGRWSLAGKVGRNVFWPAPNVDSALLRFVAGQRPGDDELRAATFAAIDAGFGQRRKTLRQALAGWAEGADRAAALLADAGVPSDWRAERLELGDFVRIAQAGMGRDR